jgi:hypothetical protein
MFLKAFGQLQTLVNNFEADPGEKSRSTLTSSHGVNVTKYALVRDQRDVDELKEQKLDISLVQVNGVDRELAEQLEELVTKKAVEGSAATKVPTPTEKGQSPSASAAGKPPAKPVEKPVEGKKL